jgi:hypothetical protein
MKSIRAHSLQAAVFTLACAGLLAFATTSFAQTVPFVPTGVLSTPLYQQDATLLNTGKVLISGGQGPTGTANPELYDPATGTFSPTGNMVTPRLFNTVTLLSSGKVLFTGGFDQSPAINRTVLATAELYDPATGIFSATGDMATPRVQHTATLLNNGKVLIAGGWNYSVGIAGQNDLASAELYDPATGTFTATGSMTVPRYGAAATLLNNGKVLITGGSIPNPTNGSFAWNTAELYDSATGTFTATGNMANPRYIHTETLLNNGLVLVTAGSVPGISELYDPSTGTFTTTGNMNIARALFSTTLLNDGKVLVAGGYSYDLMTYLNTAELFDPATGTFTLNGCVYDPPTATYSPGCLSVPRGYQSATLLNDGKVLIAGGLDSNYAPAVLASAELFDLPAVSLSATTIDFGNQTTGISSAPHSVTLTNNLPTSITITSIAPTGANASDFTQSNNCGSSVARGSSCAVDITFTPAAIGSRSASLTITDNAPGSPQTASLTGAGIAPAPVVSLSSSALTFTNQIIGTTSPSQQVTLNNTGYAPLTIANIAITGIDNSDFAQANTCGSSVAAGASCTIAVNFTPTAVGARTASVTITDNAIDSPESVSLTGSGVAPAVTLSGTSISFNGVAVGSSSGAQTLTLTNNGTATLTITGISITGANGGDFIQTNTCGASLAAGANCTISVTFTPTNPGTRTASVTITDNASDSPQSVLLMGNALAPIASVSPSSISFPNQYVGTSGLPQTVTLTNTGTAPLIITSVVTSPTDFGQLSSCGNSLSAGSSCAIGVFFDPAASGVRTGTLRISHNGMGSPQAVSLTGAGEDFSITPSSAATVTVASGQTASYSLSLVPNGGFNQSVAFSCTGAPAHSRCTVSPNPVVLNGSAAVTVSVTVSTAASSLSFQQPLVGGPPRMTGNGLIPACAGLLGLALLTGMLTGWGKNRHPRLNYGLSVLLLLCAGIWMSACTSGSSSGGSQGTPTGTYTLAVSGTFTSGSTTLSHMTNLTVKVQ